MDTSTNTKTKKQSNSDSPGKQMHQLMRDLFPICRSITGNGFRETMHMIDQKIPLQTYEVKSGTAVFDWNVPREWNIRDAYVKDSTGRRVIDFRQSNLHVLNYSIPVRQRMNLDELKAHLITLPEYPDWIPYRTSYYKEDWGFCLSHNKFLELKEGEYDVCIDSSLEAGSLAYAECFIKGARDREILISTHACHPSLCNDNLSGVALSVQLAMHLKDQPLNNSYRFLFIPGTIGSITWLSQNESNVSVIHGGMVIACAGDAGKVTYKKSRRGNAEIDRAAENVLRNSGQDYEIQEFSPYGYDERQFCSPGFNLPVGCFMRTPFGKFPEYHTSADNLDFIKPESLEDSYSKILSILFILENNRTYRNLNPKCEPQLGKRGLYHLMGGSANEEMELALFWVLNLSDEHHSLLDISERSGMSFVQIQKAADLLQKNNLLEEIPLP